MIKGIAHIALKVTDMDKSIDFYCNKLGLTRAFDLDDKEGNPWIVYLKICDGAFIELFYGGKTTPETTEESTGFLHICIECDDVYETVSSLRAKGVEIDVEPCRGVDKNSQAWIHDPDGTKIELMTIDPQSPQAQ